MVLNVLNLGLVPYETALQLQRTLMELRKAGRIENTLLLLEHPPVITLGRNAQLSNVLASPEFLAQRGVELFDIDRGGDVTFHGPGQLVAYPIFDLRSFEPKLGAVEFVRRLEEVLIRTCGDFGIATQRIKGLTGVWTYALRNKPEAKIAALGVHISRGVTTHGFALNVSTDLDFFSLIVPCGITNKPVTSMERELQKKLTVGRSGDGGVAQLRSSVPLADAVAGVARRPAGAGYRGAESRNRRVSGEPGHACAAAEGVAQICMAMAANWLESYFELRNRGCPTNVTHVGQLCSPRISDHASKPYCCFVRRCPLLPVRVRADPKAARQLRA